MSSPVSPPAPFAPSVACPAASAAAPGAAPATKEKEFIKRPVFMLVQYNGLGYCGLQYQPAAATIEGELFRAVCAAGGVSAQNSESMQKVHWMRCARTDKGVHASVNLVAFKCLLTSDSSDATAALKDRVNSLLPEAIRVIAIERSTNGFHAKYQCTSRSYEYVLPSYALNPAIGGCSISVMLERGRSLEKMAAEREIMYKKQIMNTPIDEELVMERPVKRFKKSKDASDSEGELSDDEGAAAEPVKLSDEEIEQLKAFRISGDELATVDRILQKFVGSHNFFAFTRHRGQVNREDKDAARQKRLLIKEAMESAMASDAAATIESTSIDKFLFMKNPALLLEKFHAAQNRRFIHSFAVSQVFVDQASGIEFIRFTVHGQSFMLNQIRKMMALVVITARGVVQEAAVFPTIFTQPGYNLPIAPASGLYLDRPFFDIYDKKCRSNDNPESKNRTPIGEIIAANESLIMDFKRNSIMKAIVSKETTTYEVYQWIKNLFVQEELITLKPAQDTKDIKQEIATEPEKPHIKVESASAAAASAAAASSSSSSSSAPATEVAMKSEQV